MWDRVALGAAVALLAVQSLSESEPAAGVDRRAFDAGAAALLTVACALVALGRRAPATGALGNLVVTVVWYRMGYLSGLVNVPSSPPCISSGPRATVGGSSSWAASPFSRPPSPCSVPATSR